MSFSTSRTDERFWQIVSRLAAAGRRDVAVEIVQNRLRTVDAKSIGAAALGDASPSDTLLVRTAVIEVHRILRR